MIPRRTPGPRVQFLFRALAVAALVGAFFQVTLGGVVRVTESGLGCPDWPLCHGRIIPPFDLATIIEYSHRLSASALVVLVVLMAIMTLLFYRSNRWVLRASLLCVALVVAAGVFGGVTVLADLAWWTVLVHLGIAEILVATIVVVVLTSWRAHRTSAPVQKRDRSGLLVPAAVVGAFALILSGSYMVGYGAGSACPSWPLCRGGLIPEGTAYTVHMVHRLAGAVIGVIIIVAALRSWSRREQDRNAGWAGLALGVTFVVQVLLGAWMVWSGFAAELKVVHLSLATVVWVALMFLAALIYSPGGFEAARAGSRAEGVSQLKGFAA